jgi:peptide/nickel transport system ATP-binding protein
MMIPAIFNSVILSCMKQPLLSVENLSINFTNDGASVTAVRDISFNIDAGEILAIVGESGSGKSVTALSIMQLLPKQTNVKGKMSFSPKENETVDLLNISSKKINNIRGKDMAMIFQEPMTSLNPVFTCGYQVMETIQLHEGISLKAAREKAIELFEKVNLPNPAEIIDRYPHQLSGGQKQRVMIAMAMSCNPSLLIADEPTTALDVTVQKTIVQLIKQLQQQTGMGVIFITHDLGLVADIADRVLVMYKGEIIEQGKTKDVLQNPQKAYTKALLACRPSMHSPGETLPVVSDFLNEKSKLKSPDLTDVSVKKNALAEKGEGIITLAVENLKVYFPERKYLFKNTPEPFKAVDDVSFAVYKGETIGLVGESGCGKTTLGRAILQLVPTTSGSVILDGENLAALSKRKMRPFRKDLQIVFQDPYGSLNPRIMIGNAIMEPMKVNGILNNRKQRRERVVEFLEKVGLSADHFTRYPHQFSGGQRQRICIARALAMNPSFLIFDESVSALDVSVQAQILNLLNDLKKEFRFTSIFISHDLSVVRYISDRIIVMSKGKIVEEGPAEEIYCSPKNEYTKKLIDAIPGKSILS